MVFDLGGEDEDDVDVTAGETAEVHLEPPSNMVAYRHREGWSVGIGLGGGLVLDFLLPPTALVPAGGGAVELAVNGAVSPLLDMRFAPQVGVGAIATGYNVACPAPCESGEASSSAPGSGEPGFVFTALVAARLNVASPHADLTLRYMFLE